MSIGECYALIDIQYLFWLLPGQADNILAGKVRLFISQVQYFSGLHTNDTFMWILYKGPDRW